MSAWELLTGRASAPSTTFTALTMSTGNSSTIRNTGIDTDIRLVNIFCKHQTAGNFRVRSPRLHDNVQGIRLFSVASEVEPLMPWTIEQRLYSQDQLTLEITGSATAGDLEFAALLVWYENLPGVDQRMIGNDDLLQRMVDLVTVENTLALGTGGDYSGEEALNTEFNLLRANTDYAILGYQVSVECLCVRWRGIDLGNLGVGGPGNELRKSLTASWFMHLAMVSGKAAIPVFNSSNQAGLLLDGIQDENGADVTVTTILAELS